MYTACITLSLSVFSQITPKQAETKWVDSVYKSLTPDERIAQLLVVRANDPGGKYFSKVDKYIQQYNIGGITFFGGHPTAQVIRTNHWQKLTKTPLLITIDAEWGLGMRLDSTVSFPYQMTLGAISDDELIFEMGREIARQCNRMGIQMNFAPVVDVNSNPANPVINMRSFGEDRQNVAKKGVAYMQGLQQEGVIAVAKHFPGHGDTGSDSHKTLPLIFHDHERLDSIELYPFKKMIANGVDGIMIAHLYIPALDDRKNLASTLSDKIVSDLLVKKLGYNGLIITDALDMKGVTKYYKPGNIEVKALQAGNELLILSADVPKAIKAIKKAIADGDLSGELIDKKCRKVLSYKYRAGLYDLKPVNINGLYDDLNDPQSELINRKLFENAITLVKNNSQILPLKHLDTLKLASVSIGYNRQTAFQDMLSYYAPIDHYFLPKGPVSKNVRRVLKSLEEYDLVIVSLQNTGLWAGNDFGISKQSLDFINKLQASKKIVLDLFASPYALKLLQQEKQAEAIIISYQDHVLSQELSAQAIFGGIAFMGRLPVTASAKYPVLTGFITEPARLKYTIPCEVNISEEDLIPIDSIIERCLELKVFPGCQIVAAKDGKVFFSKSYGYHTYNKKDPVNDFDIYDVASLTKIAAAVPSVMRLNEQGKLNIDQVLLKYLPFLRQTDKAPIVIREMLAHQSRFQAWIPYYRYTLIDGVRDPEIYSDKISEDHPVRVAQNIYIGKDYKYVIYDSIIKSPLRADDSYKYSDLGFYLLKEIIENISNMALEEYVREQFYDPLGLSTTGYLPRTRFPLNRLIPTEQDKTFRNQLLQGDVHDQGTALLGGISGHAGIFSNANDMAILMQMYLNQGSYGGDKYFESGTLKEFTKRQFPLNDNRRGIGFDKALIVFEEDGPNCESASEKSFGHSGFTGTYMWADPENGLVYVFLSNRVHPNMHNNKISEFNVRTNIHQVFYDAIEKRNRRPKTEVRSPKTGTMN